MKKVIVFLYLTKKIGRWVDKSKENEDAYFRIKKEMDISKKELLKDKKIYSRHEEVWKNTSRKKDEEIQNLKKKQEDSIFSKDQRTQVKNGLNDIKGYIEPKAFHNFYNSKKGNGCQELRDAEIENIEDINQKLRDELNKCKDFLQFLNKTMFDIVKKRNEQIIWQYVDDNQNKPTMPSGLGDRDGDKVLVSIKDQNGQYKIYQKENNLLEMRNELIDLGSSMSGDVICVLVENAYQFKDYLETSDQVLLEIFESLQQQQDCSKKSENDHRSALKEDPEKNNQNLFPNIDEKALNDVLGSYKLLVEGQNEILSKVLINRNAISYKQGQENQNQPAFFTNDDNNKNDCNTWLDDKKKKFEESKGWLTQQKDFINKTNQEYQFAVNLVEDTARVIDFEKEKLLNRRMIIEEEKENVGGHWEVNQGLEAKFQKIQKEVFEADLNNLRDSLVSNYSKAVENSSQKFNF